MYKKMLCAVCYDLLYCVALHCNVCCLPLLYAIRFFVMSRNFVLCVQCCVMLHLLFVKLRWTWPSFNQGNVVLFSIISVTSVNRFFLQPLHCATNFSTK